MVMARLHHLSVLDIDLREWRDVEDRRYERWFYVWGRRGCSDFTDDGQLCQCWAGLPPSVPWQVPVQVTVHDLMGPVQLA